jgi:hypothetical protein
VMALPKLIGQILAAVLFTTDGQLGLALITLVLVGLRLRRRRRHARPPLPADLKVLHKALRTMDRFVARWGVVRASGETLCQFADRLAAEKTAGRAGQNAANWYRGYASVRYRPVRDSAVIERITQSAKDFRPS